MEPRIKTPAAGFIAILFATIGGLWIIDVFLARVESLEMQNQARRDFTAGSRLLNQSRAVDALDLLRKAHALDRTNGEYGLRLAEALIASGKLDEAERLLDEIVERNPNDGEANLIEARLMVRNQKFAEASAYYHRAIYGIWSTGAPARMVQVRLELAGMLAAHGAQKDLLAELLPLESEGDSQVPVLKQVARLYITAGSAARAATVDRVLIRADATDGENYASLGDAELAVGDYRAAQVAFEEAIRRGAAGDLKSRVELAGEMAGLDPTLRRLGSIEKFARSLRILQKSRDALAGCTAAGDAGEMISSADKVLAQKTGPAVNNELAEERLSMAERLWRARTDACGLDTSVQEAPLRLIMVKLAQ